jgi:uncharacterized protein YndB with AHSA1/START domain
MPDSVTVERTIHAPAELVAEMVSNVERMGEWSPENTRCEWKNDATGPAVGARFQGTNKNGSKSWKTGCRVTKWEPGREFAFTVDKPVAVSDWAYSFKPTANGCVVTESWTDRRGKFIKLLGKPFSGVADRVSHNRAGMEITLARLANAAEAAAAADAADAAKE